MTALARRRDRAAACASPTPPATPPTTSATCTRRAAPPSSATSPPAASPPPTWSSPRRRRPTSTSRPGKSRSASSKPGRPSASRSPTSARSTTPPSTWPTVRERLREEAELARELAEADLRGRPPRRDRRARLDPEDRRRADPGRPDRLPVARPRPLLAQGAEREELARWTEPVEQPALAERRRAARRQRLSSVRHVRVPAAASQIVSSQRPGSETGSAARSGSAAVAGPAPRSRRTSSPRCRVGCLAPAPADRDRPRAASGLRSSASRSTRPARLERWNGARRARVRRPRRTRPGRRQRDSRQ